MLVAPVSRFLLPMMRMSLWQGVEDDGILHHELPEVRSVDYFDPLHPLLHVWHNFCERRDGLLGHLRTATTAKV